MSTGKTSDPLEWIKTQDHEPVKVLLEYLESKPRSEVIQMAQKYQTKLRQPRLPEEVAKLMYIRDQIKKFMSRHQESEDRRVLEQMQHHQTILSEIKDVLKGFMGASRRDSSDEEVEIITRGRKSPFVLDNKPPKPSNNAKVRTPERKLSNGEPSDLIKLHQVHNGVEVDPQETLKRELVESIGPKGLIYLSSSIHDLGQLEGVFPKKGKALADAEEEVEVHHNPKSPIFLHDRSPDSRTPLGAPEFTKPVSSPPKRNKLATGRAVQAEEIQGMDEAFSKVAAEQPPACKKYFLVREHTRDQFNLLAEVQPSQSHLSMLRAVMKSGQSSSLAAPVQMLTKQEYEERILLGRPNGENKSRKASTSPGKRSHKTDQKVVKKDQLHSDKKTNDRIRQDAVAKLLLYGKDFDQLEWWVDDTDDNMRGISGHRLSDQSSSDGESGSSEHSNQTDSSQGEDENDPSLAEEAKRKLVEDRRHHKESALKQMFDSKYTDTFFMLNKHRMEQVYDSISDYEQSKKKRKAVRKKRKELDRVGGKKKITLDESENTIKLQNWSPAEAKREALRVEANLLKRKNKKSKSPAKQVSKLKLLDINQINEAYESDILKSTERMSKQSIEEPKQPSPIPPTQPNSVPFANTAPTASQIRAGPISAPVGASQGMPKAANSEPNPSAAPQPTTVPPTATVVPTTTPATVVQSSATSTNNIPPPPPGLVLKPPSVGTASKGPSPQVSQQPSAVPTPQKSPKGSDSRSPSTDAKPTGISSSLKSNPFLAKQSGISSPVPEPTQAGNTKDEVPSPPKADGQVVVASSLKNNPFLAKQTQPPPPPILQPKPKPVLLKPPITISTTPAEAGAVTLASSTPAPPGEQDNSTGSPNNPAGGSKSDEFFSVKNNPFLKPKESPAMPGPLPKSPRGPPGATISSLRGAFK